MKMVVDLPETCTLEPGTVLHTFGYPEPEIFGFLYVYPDRVASLGIFVPSWFDNPVRTAYRYLQHWMTAPVPLAAPRGRHAALVGREVAAGVGPARRAAPGGRRLRAHRRGIGQHQCADRLRRGRGLDDRRAAGARACSSCCSEKKPFTRENLEDAYVARRRASWLEKEARVAEKSRDGFHEGRCAGLIGMGLTGLTRRHG